MTAGACGATVVLCRIDGGESSLDTFRAVVGDLDEATLIGDSPEVVTMLREGVAELSRWLGRHRDRSRGGEIVECCGSGRFGDVMLPVHPVKIRFVSCAVGIMPVVDDPGCGKIGWSSLVRSGWHRRFSACPASGRP